MCVCLTLFVVWSRPVALFDTFKRAPWMYLGLGFFGTTVGTTMLYAAIDQLSLSVASIVGKLQPVFVLIMAYIFLKERLTRAEIVLSILAILGACLVAIPNPLAIFETAHATVFGLLAALASSLGWAISGVFGKRLSMMANPPSASQLTFFRYFIGSTLVMPVVDFGEYSTTVSEWPYAAPFLPTVLVLAFLTVTVPTWAFYKGLKHVSVSYASILELSTPITGVVLGFVFLGDRLNLTQIVGVAFVLLPVIILERLRLKAKTQA